MSSPEAPPPNSAAARGSAPITLLVVDDHPVVRDGLSSMFARDPEFEVLGEAADGAEAVRLAQELRPDVILMDLRMPGMDGVTAITELARRGVGARVLVLTTYDTDSHVVPAIEAGATGYLLKDAPRTELLRAVRAAAHGEAVLSPAVAARLMNRVRFPGAGPLSHRELEVLQLVASGHQPGGGRQAVHHRGHGQDPSAEHLRQAGGQRPGRRRSRGVQPRPAHPPIMSLTALRQQHDHGATLAHLRCCRRRRIVLWLKMGAEPGKHRIVTHVQGSEFQPLVSAVAAIR